MRTPRGPTDLGPTARMPTRLRRRRGCSSRRRRPIPGRHRRPGRPLIRMTVDHPPAHRLPRDPRPTPAASLRCPISPTPHTRLSTNSARRRIPEPRPPISIRPAGPRRRNSVPSFRRPRLPPVPPGRPTFRPAPDRITSARITSAPASSAPTSSAGRHRRPEGRRTTSTRARPLRHPSRPRRIRATRDLLTSRCRSPLTNRPHTRVPLRSAPARTSPDSPSPVSRCSTDTGRRREAPRSTRSR
ncbi:Uncharacterised protein [Gordonia terrae]|nr:Uncharacterised protein [Gordonia terrae]